MMSPDSRKSWQIANSLEKQATGTKTSQKIDSSGAKESASNQSAVSRINNLRKKYSVDQQDAKPQIAKVQPATQKIPRSQPTVNQPIVTKQVVLQNPMGPFIPSSNLRQKLPSQQPAPADLSKPSKTGTATTKDASLRMETVPQTVPMSQKQKQRSISPLILVVNPSLTQPLSSNSPQGNPPRSARNTSKTFQNQFKPRVGHVSFTKQKARQSPH